jgi:phosphatidate phosphatase PAH1
MKNDNAKNTTLCDMSTKSDVISTDIVDCQKASYVLVDMRFECVRCRYGYCLRRKVDNDSEQEDSEVGKLTAKIEQEKDQQRLSATSHVSSMGLRKKMILSSDELQRLNLKLGKNKVEFSVTTAWQGTTTIESNIFFLDHMTKFVISDIDGTITR